MKKYGVMQLLLDVLLTLLTGGFWLVILLIRYLRRNS